MQYVTKSLELANYYVHANRKRTLLQRFVVIMPNGISHTYQLYESLLLFGSNFGFHSNFKSIFCKQTVPNLARRRILIWFCSVCLCPIEFIETIIRGLYGSLFFYSVHSLSASKLNKTNSESCGECGGNLKKGNKL